MSIFVSDAVLNAQRSELALPVLQQVAYDTGMPLIPRYIQNWSSDTQQFFRAEWDMRRTPRPLACSVCGNDEFLGKYHWHHKDETLRHAMIQARDECYTYSFADATWQGLFREFAVAVAMYYLVPVEETIFMCSSCHARHHHSKK